MTRVSSVPSLMAAVCDLFCFLRRQPSWRRRVRFSDLEGAWSGAGQIRTKAGEKERIRCRATYTIGRNGSGLNQVLTCASDKI